jgi:hypothetical protein
MAKARAGIDVMWVAAEVRGQRRCPLAVLVLIASLATANARIMAQPCVGDCNGGGRVEVNELVLGVNIALEARPLTDCPSLDNGEGRVTVDRLVLAVSNLLNSCGGTPTPTATPTGQVSVSMWIVDDYDVESDCAGVLEDAVRDGLEARGPDYTVRRTGDDVEIEDSEGNTIQGTVDPDGTVHVQEGISDSIATCDYDVDFDASVNLNQSPTTATYDGSVKLSGFCLGFDDCSIQITARWRQVGSPTPGQDTPTPTATPTPGTGTPTVTPTSQVSVSTWTVDDYDVVDSDCADVLENAVRDGLEARGPDYTVRRTGDDVEIEDSEGNTIQGMVDPDGTVHVQEGISDSIATCDYDVDFDASANLNESPTTATYDGSVNLSGFCLGLDDCSVQITARWRRVEETLTGRKPCAAEVSPQCHRPTSGAQSLRRHSLWDTE